MTETNSNISKIPDYKITVTDAQTRNISPERRKKIGQSQPSILPKYGYSIQPKPTTK